MILKLTELLRNNSRELQKTWFVNLKILVSMEVAFREGLNLKKGWSLVLRQRGFCSFSDSLCTVQSQQKGGETGHYCLPLSHCSALPLPWPFCQSRGSRGSCNSSHDSGSFPYLWGDIGTVQKLFPSPFSCTGQNNFTYISWENRDYTECKEEVFLHENGKH